MVHCKQIIRSSDRRDSIYRYWESCTLYYFIAVYIFLLFLFILYYFLQQGNLMLNLYRLGPLNRCIPRATTYHEIAPLTLVLLKGDQVGQKCAMNQRIQIL